MDASIRLYNSNSRLRATAEVETRACSTRPLVEEEEQERATTSTSTEALAAGATPAVSSDTREEPVQGVDVADFEAIFQRYQGPILNYIYHLIGNREQAYDLAQDVFVKAYKALLG